MSHVYTANGEPIDPLAVSAEDMFLTVLARLDLLDDDSLTWLATRCLKHAEHCLAQDYPEQAAVYTAMVKAIEAVQRTV